MKTLKNSRMQAVKTDRVQRWGPMPKEYHAVLRQGRGPDQGLILEVPHLRSLGIAARPGTRVWFAVIGAVLWVTVKPLGQRGMRRYSSRLRRTHLPLTLLRQYGRTVPPKKRGRR